MQKLVRYEALFKLLEDVHAADSVGEIAARVAAQWKYFANVAAWHLVIVGDGGRYLVIDGCRGEARVDEAGELSPWDRQHWESPRPSLLPGDDPAILPLLPAHMMAASISEILVLPLVVGGIDIGLLSVSARHQPFDHLDFRFIRMFGTHLAERLSSLLLQRRLTAELQDKAAHDALTGLLNRGTVVDRLSSLLALARRTQQPLGTILIDIDHFKSINDSYGHLAGDEVLREVARRLQVLARSAETVGRYGGEEFLVVLYPCDENDIARAAERFRVGVAEAPFALPGGEAIRIALTISLGSVTTRAPAEVSPEALLCQADAALYRSKRDGRNRVTASCAAGV